MNTKIRALTAAAVMAAVLLVTGHSTGAATGVKTFTVSMPYLESFQTTEAGEDEVYLLVSGRWAGGETFSLRFPSASGHWDLNDREGDPAVTNQQLFNLQMQEGQVVDLAIMVMEEDGGTSKPWVDVAGTVANVLLPELGSVLNLVAPFLNFKDSDDFIGSFSMRIENRNGQAVTSIKPLDRVFESSDPNQYWVRFNMNMNGDGSRYRSQFAVNE